MWQAEQNLSEDIGRPDPKIIRIRVVDEEAKEQMARVSGDSYEQIDYTAAVERLRRAREE